MFPGPYKDVLVRSEAWALKLAMSEHEGDPDPLDRTPIHHMNTSMKATPKDTNLYEVMGHKDDDAALDHLGSQKIPKGSKNMYTLGIWFPFGKTRGAYFFFTDYNVRIALDEPISIIWSSSFTHGSFGSVNCTKECELVGTALDVSQRAINYLKNHRSPNA